MIAAWLASPRGRWMAALSATVALLVLLPAEGMTGSALRALGLLGALALAAGALRRRAEPERPVALLDRQPLGGGSGIALVEAEGHRLLVGYGPSGVALLGELSQGSNP